MAVVRFPVEAGHIMMFARAIGEPNPVYHTAEQVSDRPTPAPPTFTIVSAQFDPDFSARPRIGKPWKGSGKNPTGAPQDVPSGGTGLYAEQSFDYHAPVYAGDVLTGEAKPGRNWDKPGRRGGRLSFQETVTEWRNQRDELVVTSRKVVVFTSQTVTQKSRLTGGTAMALKHTQVRPGDRYSMVVVEDLKRTMLVQYAGVSGDYNPVHTDEIFATRVAGYPTVFAHGMLSMGMTGRMLTDYVGVGNLTRYGVRFTRQVFPGDTLTATATVTSLREENGAHLVDLDVVTVNQNGEEVLKGQATARCEAN